MQQFFDQNLKALVDTSSRPWNWKPEVTQADRLSNATLRQFERADLIKQAFFPTGNAFPSIGLQVVPRALSQQADAASLEVNGNLVLVTRGPGFNADIEPLPASFDWPSNTATPRVVLVIQPEVPGYRSRQEVHDDRPAHLRTGKPLQEWRQAQERRWPREPEPPVLQVQAAKKTTQPFNDRSFRQVVSRSVSELDCGTVLQIEEIRAINIRDARRHTVQDVIDMQPGKAVAGLAGKVKLQDLSLSGRNA